jgi:predicted permease
MATTPRSRSATPIASQLNLTRALGIAATVAAAVAVWVVAVPILGLHLDIRFGTSPAQTIGIGFVVGATLSASLLGWALLALLESRTARARTVWTAAAVVFLVASLSLPLYAGISGSTKLALAVMHLAAAAVVITVMRSTSPK